MEDEDGQPTTPFWLQNGTTPFRRRRVPSPSSFFLNSTTLIVLLLALAALLFFFIIPSVLSFTSQIFKPNVVKKTWDSLNLVLVLFAIICGFLSRTSSSNDTASSSSSSSSELLQSSSSSPSAAPPSNPVTPQYRWYDNHHQAQNFSDRVAGNSSLYRLRSSSSYPDLRQEEPSLMHSSGGLNNQYKSLDDTHLSYYRLVDRVDHGIKPENTTDDFSGNASLKIYQRFDRSDHQSHKLMPKVEDKIIQLDTVRSQVKEAVPEAIPAPALPADSPPSSLPPSTVRRRTKRAYKHVEAEDYLERREEEDDLKYEPPTSPPHVSAKGRREIEKKSGGSSSGGGSISGKSERKRAGGATKEFLTSLYHHKRRNKKQRQKSVENLEVLMFSPPPNPPPPPPPPPPSVFQNLFSSKKNKSKKLPKQPTQTSKKPPLHEKMRNLYTLDDNVSSGSESPIRRGIPPPPPPPPPFAMSPWRFAVQGDYVRVNSNKSSRSVSPDWFDDEISSGDSPQAEAPAVGIFCPSPDVDTKADNFIARFRAGLQLEKMNSFKAKQGGGVGMSRLGPEPSPKSGPSTRD